MNVAKKVFRAENAYFIIDQAQSNGVIGPNGATLVSPKLYLRIFPIGSICLGSDAWAGDGKCCASLHAK